MKYKQQLIQSYIKPDYALRYEVLRKVDELPEEDMLNHYMLKEQLDECKTIKEVRGLL